MIACSKVPSTAQHSCRAEASPHATPAYIPPTEHKVALLAGYISEKLTQSKA